MNEGLGTIIVLLIVVFGGLAAIWGALEATDTHQTESRVPTAIVLGILFLVLAGATAYLVSWLNRFGKAIIDKLFPF